MDEDCVAVATAINDHVLAYAATTRQLVGQLQRRHDTWPVVTAALGRVATVGAMMTPMLKDTRHQVTLQINGNGPVGKIVVVATGDGKVRGYVDEPHVDLPLNVLCKLDVGQAVGREGSLYVLKDLGLKDPYRGSVPLTTGEIGEDFTYYFAVSEQIPTAVSVGVLVDRDISVLAAGGLLVQILPEAQEEEIAMVEEAVSVLPSITSILREGQTPLEILRQVFASDFKLLATKPAAFGCDCNKPRLARVLLSLGKSELASLIAEQGEAELVCHFCAQKYVFTEEELAELRDEARY